MSYAETQRWLDATKAGELRDSWNWRGAPGAGGALASQQGLRGSPIVDVSCVPGLELYKVSAVSGAGYDPGRGATEFQASGDFLWGSAGNLDLSFLMWNQIRFQNSQPTQTNWNFCCGVLLRGDTAAAVQADDVFGAVPAEMVLVSGTHAWRVRFSRNSYPGDSGFVGSSAAGYLSNELVALETVSINNSPVFNGWRSNSGTSYWIGSQFIDDTPIPSLLYCFADGGRLGTSSDATTHGGTELLGLMQANYATFRIYDFTLTTEQTGGQTGRLNVPATMPPSMSGAITNSERVADPDNPETGTIANRSFWYISDAIVAPRAPRSIAVAAGWVSERSLPVGNTLTIADVPSEAFTATSGDNFAVGVAPAQIENAIISYNRSSGAFNFTSAQAGVYRVVFTAALAAEPGKRAEAVLTITVTP